MTKRSEKPGALTPGKNEKMNITISAVRTKEGFQIVEMFGHLIRAEIENGEPWFVVQDLSKMFGIHPTTIPKRIDNNPDDFDGWVRLTDITSSRGKSAGLENLNQSILLVNEQAVYSIMGGLTTKRIKNPEAREMVRKFKRAFPELLKMIRTGEVKVVKNDEWDVKRYLSKDGYKRVSKSIHDFIQNLARDPAHEVHVHTNNAIMVNKIVFGQHFKGIRDTATVIQLEAIFALDQLNSSLIEQGRNVQKERGQILSDYFIRHFNSTVAPTNVLSNQSALPGCEA